MARIAMRYGDDQVAFDVENAACIEVLEVPAPKPIEDLAAAFAKAITVDCIDSPPLCEVVRPGDQVTIVVSDITRFWMRQDLICKLLVQTLQDDCGIAPEDIIFLVALGTHRMQTKDELRKIVSDEIYDRFQVLNHDCDADDLVCVGTTTRGTQVCVNPLAVGRKLIIIGGTVHHLMSGFGGGRKSVVPGISSRHTINQNHLHSLDPDAERSNPLIGMGKLLRNPVHEDMVEAAALVNPAFGINIVMGGGQHHALCCGHWLHAWEKSCDIVQAVSGLEITEQADIVIASCGGFPRDIDLYQGTKSLLNAAQAVRPGGTILFLAECREGGGPPTFFGWIDSLTRRMLDADLRANFAISGYIFYACCEAMAASQTHMLTNIAPETLAAMGIRASADLEALLEQIDFAGKTVYLMPSAGSTVPFLTKK